MTLWENSFRISDIHSKPVLSDLLSAEYAVLHETCILDPRLLHYLGLHGLI